MRIDLHVHTKYSGDALIEPNVLLKIARKRMLDGVAITDHETLKGWKSIPNTSLAVIPGIEKRTNLGSIIGLFVTDNVNTSQFHETVDEIRSQGGIVVLPHPCDSFRRDTLKIDQLDKNTLEKEIDVVEVFNSRCAFNYFNDRARKLAEKLEKCMVGGSDAHFPFEVGNAYTIFNVVSEEEIYRTLKNGTLTSENVHGKLSNRFVHPLTLLCKTLKTKSNFTK